MANWWSLKVISGPDSGKTYVLKRDRTVIGRVKGDICLRQDLELSSVHAEITFDASKGLLILADLQSRNGCRVNGEKVEKRALIPGDKLRFGVTELILEPPSAEETIVSRSSDADATRVADSQPKPASEAPAAKAPIAEEKRADKSAPANAEKSSDEKKSPEPASEKKERSRERPRDELSGGPEFYGFFGRFFGVLFQPTKFFDFLASENALISGDQAFRTAVQFGILSWFGGGLISGGLSYLCLYVWKTTQPGADFGSSPIAIGIVTVLGALLLPLIALIYHGFCLLLGGKGPFKVAMRVVCYVSAVHFVKNLVLLIPRAGPFFAIGLDCYTLYLLALAATRLYYLTMGAAYASCAVSVAIAIAVGVVSRNSALHMQDELAKLNPILNKSIGATFVLGTDTGASGASVAPAATTPAATVATKPAQTAPAETTTAEQPANTDTSSTANTATAETTTPSETTTPPAADANKDQQRDPAASTTPDAAPAADGADPEPPKMPSSQ